MTWHTAQPAPTLEELKKHFDRYGLDKVKGGYRRKEWVDPNYSTWNQMKGDSLIEVARFFLPTAEVLELVEHITDNERVIKEAIEELTDGADDVRDTERRAKREGVSGTDGTKQPKVSTNGSRRRNSRSSRSRSR